MTLPLSLRAMRALRPRRLRQAPPDPSRRPPGPLVWFHVHGEGGLLAIEELVNRLHQQDDHVEALVTTAGAVPLDRDGITFRAVPSEGLQEILAFLSLWQPDLLVWTRGQLRPLLLSEALNRAIPTVLINAQAEGLPAPSGLRVPGVTRALMRGFERLIAVDDAAAAQLRRLGAPPWRIEVAGALEEGTAAPPCSESLRDNFAEALNARPTWFAACINKAEVEAVLNAHRIAQRISHRLLLIIQPDSTEAAAAIRAGAAERSMRLGSYAEFGEPEDSEEIFLTEPGELSGLWYRLASVSFLGGTLLGKPCPNPFEAAALGSAIIHGSRITQFRGSYERLAAAGATIQIDRGASLGQAVQTLLAPDQSAARAHAAWEVTSSGANVTDRVIQLIQDGLKDAS